MCYNIFFRKLFCLLFVFWGVVSIHAQQVTKEQLLKLFYQANAARSANQTDVAIKTYVDILKLSPGLPDPYLQLGDLYSAMTQDAVALEKACVCYENYLLLKPDASNAESLKTKISELTLNIKQLNAGAMQLVENQLQVSTDMANSQDTEKLLEETADVSVETLIEKKDTMQVIAADTNRIVPIVSNQPIDDALLGRWVSADLGADGREIWIFDISKDADNYCFALNDSSYIKKTNSMLKNVKLLKAPAYVEGDALVMTYVVNSPLKI